MADAPRPAPPPPALAAEPPVLGRRLPGAVVAVDDAARRALADACAVVDDTAQATADAGRDWWPLAMVWALDGQLPARPGVVARPGTVDEVAAVLRVCHERRLPVTAAGGRSGVCGAAVPVHGGVALDLTGLAGVVAVDDASLTADVAAGTVGSALEATLRADHGVTLGHWPQSIELSTVGGWVACRSAGQLSTRYGKIEDMVVGLEVVLADGAVLRTGGAPRAAAGPDLTQLFVGSEGTLGVVTRARLRVHPVPPAEHRSAWAFARFTDGLDACRRVLRRGATPAVLRLHDDTESRRSHDVDANVALVLDEADPHLVAATAAVVEEEFRATPGAERLDDAAVGRWLAHRNDVSALGALVGKGFVVDTLEVAAPWSALDAVYRAGIDALRAVPGVAAASAHQSHAYTDGACLYFSLAGRPAPEDRERLYVAAWDAATRAVLGAGANLSHHHGVGLNRARFVADALGDTGLATLAAVKGALDPRGVLNPGKLGLPDPWGTPGWPEGWR